MSLLGRSFKIYVRYLTFLPHVHVGRNARDFGHNRFSVFRKLVRGVSSVKIGVNKTECLFDEEVVVKVTGLSPKDKVTIVATTQQDQLVYWSHGLFSANQDGVVDLRKDRPISGSYDEADPAGLLWSMTSAPWLPKGTRLFQARAVRPRIYNFSVFPPSDTCTPSDFLTDNTAQLASVEHKRWYKGPHVRRVPIDHPRIRGTLFLPEGTGPFPGIIDMYGGLVTIVEGRAALLASHGFASLSLSYVHGEGLPPRLIDIEEMYFHEVADWFAKLPEVRSDGIGVFGLCLGGTVALMMTQSISNIRAVVNINGMPFVPAIWTRNGQPAISEFCGLDRTKLVYNGEGLVGKDMYLPLEQHFFKPWKHGAHLLTLLSGDDLMTDMNHNIRLYNELMPKKYRQEKAELEFYPGAGHLIEPPYTPLCRYVDTTKQFMEALGLEYPTPYPSNLLMAGGFPKEHAVAEKKGWDRILNFLKKHLT